MNIGATLREAREGKGLSLTEVENKTKIRAKYLAALESEDYREIPGEAYILGFLRNYARFLELDADQLVSSYKAQNQADEHPELPPLGEPGKDTPQEPVPHPSGTGVLAGFPLKWKRTGVILLAVVVAGLLILGIVIGVGRGHNPTHSASTPAHPPTSQTSRVKVAKPQFIRLELVARDKCWVRVTVDDVVKFAGIMPPGTTKDFQARNSVNLRLGNAGGVQVIYNGKKLPPLGRRGEVIEKQFTRS